MSQRRSPLLELLGLSLALAACLPQAPPSPEARVRPITEILASGPEFTDIYLN